MGMIESIGDIVKNVVVIIFLTTILDMTLPNSDLQPFIKMIMGLFIIVSILNPIIAITKTEAALTGWTLQVDQDAELDSIMAQGESYNQLAQGQVLLAYESKLAQQIQGLVALTQGVASSEVVVKLVNSEQLGAIGAIDEVEIWVEVLVPADGDWATSEAEVIKQVRAGVCNYYTLSPEQLKVNLVKGAS